MNRRDFSKSIVTLPIVMAGWAVSPKIGVAAAQSGPGIPPPLPDADRHDLWMYHNPYDSAYIIAVEAERSGGWESFLTDEDSVANYIDQLDYVEDAEPVGLLDYGGKKTSGFLRGDGFIYDKRDEADAATAYRGFLNWEILGDYGYVAFSSKDDLLFMVIGLQDNEVVLEDVLTWAIRDGELPDPIGDFSLRPVTS